MEEMFVTNLGYTSHIVNSIKHMTNLQEIKTVVKTGIKKIMTESL